MKKTIEEYLNEWSKLNPCDFIMPSAKSFVKFAEFVLDQEKNITPEFQKLEDLIDIIIVKKGIDLKTNTSRESKVVNIRFIFCKIAKDMGICALKEIGKIINRDHSTVCFAVKKFNDYFETDPEFRELYYEIKNSIS